MWSQAGTRRQDIINLRFPWMMDKLVTTHTNLDHHKEDRGKVLLLQTIIPHRMHMCLLTNQIWLVGLIMGIFRGMVSPKLHFPKQLVRINRGCPEMEIHSHRKWHKEQPILILYNARRSLSDVIKINLSLLTLIMCRIKQEVWRMVKWDTH